MVEAQRERRKETHVERIQKMNLPGSPSWTEQTNRKVNASIAAITVSKETIKPRKQEVDVTATAQLLEEKISDFEKEISTMEKQRLKLESEFGIIGAETSGLRSWYNSTEWGKESVKNQKKINIAAQESLKQLIREVEGKIKVTEEKIEYAEDEKLQCGKKINAAIEKNTRSLREALVPYEIASELIKNESGKLRELISTHDKNIRSSQVELNALESFLINGKLRGRERDSHRKEVSGLRNTINLWEQERDDAITALGMCEEHQLRITGAHRKLATAKNAIESTYVRMVSEISTPVLSSEARDALNRRDEILKDKTNKASDGTESLTTNNDVIPQTIQNGYGINPKPVESNSTETIYMAPHTIWPPKSEPAPTSANVSQSSMGMLSSLKRWIFSTGSSLLQKLFSKSRPSEGIKN